MYNYKWSELDAEERAIEEQRMDLGRDLSYYAEEHDITLDFWLEQRDDDRWYVVAESTWDGSTFDYSAGRTMDEAFDAAMGVLERTTR